MAEIALAFRNDAGSVGAAQERLAAWLEEQDLGARDRHRIEMVFEELAMNVVMHGHPEAEAGLHDIAAHLTLVPGLAALLLEDDGAPFDPRDGVGEALTEAFETARIGGLGLLLVSRFATGFAHERTPEGRNRTRVELPLA